MWLANDRQTRIQSNLSDFKPAAALRTKSTPPQPSTWLKKQRDHAGQESLHFLYSQSWLTGVTIPPSSQTKTLTISDLFPILVLDFTSEKPFELASLRHFSCSCLGQGLPCSVYTPSLSPPITGHSHQNYMP